MNLDRYKILSTKKRAVVLIGAHLNESWLNFLDSFKFYDVFVAIDRIEWLDEERILKAKERFKNVTFIETRRWEARPAGFMGWIFLHQPGRVYGHEKALYYFSYPLEYDHIWFIEDDIFFHSEKTLLEIDLQYPNSDYITRNINCEYAFDENWWWRLWGAGAGVSNLPRGKDTYEEIVGFPRPMYHSLNCASRISGLMIRSIRSYAEHAKRLFCNEYYLPMAAIYNSMKISHPIELQTVLYSKKRLWNPDEMSKSCVYHPIHNEKNNQTGIYYHDKIRNFMFLNDDHFSKIKKSGLLKMQPPRVKVVSEKKMQEIKKKNNL